MLKNLPQWIDQPQSTTKILLINSLTLSVVFLTLQVARSLPIPSEAEDLSRVALESTLSATVSPVAITATPVSTPVEKILWEAEEEVVSGTDIPSLVRETENIRDYIYTIFGRNGAVAYAIALAESGRSYKGERYFQVLATHASHKELSIGIFQINLQNATTKVHFDRVPGRTLEKKIEWLQDPYNNTLMAYWIYSTSSFKPWSTYLDGKYLAYVR